MSVPSHKNGIVLGGLLALWWLSIILVALPNLGSSSPTFPASVSLERMYFFLGTAAAAAAYSAYLGLRWLRSGP